MHVARYGLKRLRDNWKNKNLLFENSALLDMKPVWKHDKIFFLDTLFLQWDLTRSLPQYKELLVCYLWVQIPDLFQRSHRDLVKSYCKTQISAEL